MARYISSSSLAVIVSDTFDTYDNRTSSVISSAPIRAITLCVDTILAPRVKHSLGVWTNGTHRTDTKLCHYLYTWYLITTALSFVICVVVHYTILSIYVAIFHISLQLCSLRQPEMTSIYKIGLPDIDDDWMNFVPNIFLAANVLCLRLLNHLTHDDVTKSD